MHTSHFTHIVQLCYRQTRRSHAGIRHACKPLYTHCAAPFWMQHSNLVHPCLAILVCIVCSAAVSSNAFSAMLSTEEQAIRQSRRARECCWRSTPCMRHCSCTPSKHVRDSCKLAEMPSCVVPFPWQVAIFKGPGESKPPVPSSHEAAQFDCIHLLRVMVKLLPTWLPDALFEVLQARWNSRQRLTRCRVNITPGFAALNLSF